MPQTRKNRNRKNRNRKTNRKMYGGYMAPVDWMNPGPMKMSLEQGQQFADYHSGQHGGASTYLQNSPYPGVVTEGSFSPEVPMDSARQTGLIQSYNEIKGMTDQAGGRRRKNRSSRKNRKNRCYRKNRSSKKNRKNRKNRKTRRQNGGDFVRWGGGRRRHHGGSHMDVENPATTDESVKMLISPQMQAQTGLNPEWKLAENPNSFDPIGKLSSVKGIY